MPAYSNYLKVVFVPEDICEMSDAVLRSNCFTVQHFSYNSQRRRQTATGNTTHAEDATLLNITIRINTPDCGRQLLDHMQDQELHAYSFLFNATFKPTGRIADYEDAMMTRGYIVDIEEDFSTNRKGGQQEQMLMHIRMLLRSITFVGRENNVVLTV